LVLLVKSYKNDPIRELTNQFNQPTNSTAGMPACRSDTIDIDLAMGIEIGFFTTRFA
jgi:hypothetical protein